MLLSGRDREIEGVLYAFGFRSVGFVGIEFEPMKMDCVLLVEKYERHESNSSSVFFF